MKIFGDELLVTEVESFSLQNLEVNFDSINSNSSI